MTPENQIQTALNAAQKPFIQELNGAVIAFTPEREGGWKMQELPALRTQPARKKGTHQLTEISSFLAFVGKHTESGSQIIVDADFGKNKVKFTAILNGHTGEQAGFADFLAQYEPAKTVDWANWLDGNSSKMGQEQFAHFLENNIANIADLNPNEPNKKYPSAADLLEFCTNLESTSTVRFRSSTKVQNGQVQFEYIEEGDSATKGKLALFETFGIGVQPFIGSGPAFFIEAKLRFRINRESGSLSLWFELQRPDKALEIATQQMIDLVKDLSKVPVYFGIA
ncbi:DUF2303 family protein [Deefgea piscis]|uniref:DUF2303 family protein n=1 Tax=Deefgea piscis TaxID=2739061 RepID=A0A6M8SJK9_9NEIS|nr:DUF2303 family protein [Deefgea piscis]QKJ65262.1 DUF2303 family protein [Deefgea piscis]